MVKSAYIHIPFCKSKCKYCSFISFPKLELKEQYLDALIKEIKYYYKGETLDTIYFGGGTPSLLTPEEFKTLLDLFNFKDETEITAELNPDGLTQDYLAKLKSKGFNRISLGGQTFNDNILQLIGRRHTSKQVEDAVKFAKNAGFDNISLDFIYGLPNQTTEMFASDLKHAISLGIQHISLYGLKIDEGCYFYTHMPENLPDEDIQADMYLKAIEILKDFEHYEISNFAKNKKYSEHNMNYWNCEEYYGFGAAAHGYLNGARYANFASISKYINSPLEKEFLKNLTPKDMQNEAIFLGLRRGTGINFIDFKNRYNTDFLEKYSVILEKYKDFFVITDTNCAFTTEGFLVSNSILADFIEL